MRPQNDAIDELEAEVSGLKRSKQNGPLNRKKDRRGFAAGVDAVNFRIVLDLQYGMSHPVAKPQLESQMTFSCKAGRVAGVKASK